MTPSLQAALDRIEGRAEVVGRFGAWYSQCLICGPDSGPWFTRLVAATSSLLHLDRHYSPTGQEPLPFAVAHTPDQLDVLCRTVDLTPPTAPREDLTR